MHFFFKHINSNERKWGPQKSYPQSGDTGRPKSGSESVYPFGSGRRDARYDLVGKFVLMLRYCNLLQPCKGYTPFPMLERIQRQCAGD